MHSGMAIPSNSADSWFIDTQAGISWQQTLPLSSSLSITRQWVYKGTYMYRATEPVSNFMIVCDMLIRILALEF